MLVRIVKMEFQQSKVNTFLELFNLVRDKIANFDGCLGVELLNDVSAPHIYFTYSTWKSEQHLENYRNSELFKNTWSKTKVLFGAKPEAWSLNPISNSKL